MVLSLNNNIRGVLSQILVQLLDEYKIQATDAANLDEFGWSCDMSDDGATVVVGEPVQKDAAYVFTFSGGNWTQQQKLVGLDTVSGDYFGQSCSISGDGETIIVGAPDKNGRRGAAYVFTRSGSVWTEQQKLEASVTEVNDDYGTQVDISTDGLTVVVSNHNQDDVGGVGFNRGSIEVWTSNGSVWTRQQEVISNVPTDFGNFGRDLALSGDGLTLMASTSNNQSFGVEVFTLSGTWTHQQTLPNTGAVNAMSLSDDGLTLAFAVGVNSHVQVYTSDTSTWTLQQTVVEDTPEPSSLFAESMDMSGDGLTLIVGASNSSDIESGAGAAYIFTSNGTTWTQQEKFYGSDIVSLDHFGYRVAVSNDGLNYISTAYWGEILPEGSGDYGGVAYIY